MPRALTVRVAAALVAVLAGVFALTALLGYFQFRETFSDLLQARFNFVVFNIKNVIESNLRLGLPLDALSDIQDVLARERAQDEQILSIDVFDETGNLLFTTDRGGIGDKVPPAWLRSTTRGLDEVWTIADEDAFIIGIPLINAFDKLVGGIALRYSSEDFETRARAVGGAFARIAGLALLAAAFLAALLTYLVFRRFEASAARLAGELQAVAAGAPAAPAASAGHSPFERDVRVLVERASEALRRIDAAEQRVEQIDKAT